MNVITEEYQKLVDLYAKSLQETIDQSNEYRSNQIILLDTLYDILEHIKKDLRMNKYSKMAIGEIIEKGFDKLKQQQLNESGIKRSIQKVK